jgi:hypothetical protein
MTADLLLLTICTYLTLRGIWHFYQLYRLTVEEVEMYREREFQKFLNSFDPPLLGRTKPNVNRILKLINFKRK